MSNTYKITENGEDIVLTKFDKKVVYTDDKLSIEKLWETDEHIDYCDSYHCLCLTKGKNEIYLDYNGKKSNKQTKFNTTEKNDKCISKDKNNDEFSVIEEEYDGFGVNKNGKELFLSKYSFIDDVYCGHRLVWIDGPDKDDIYKGRKYGFIDAKGKEIVPCVYEDIDVNWHHETNDIFIFAKNGKWGISDFNQKVLVKPQYEAIITWRNFGIAKVRNNKNLYGLITIDGKTLLPIQYEYITPLGNGYFLCKTNNKTEMMRVYLTPFNIDKAKVVILGSFPGKQSLKAGEYYANPTNQFWNLLGIKGPRYKEYKEKLNKLAKMEIGLWDVIKSCEREGSLDKNIKDKTIEFNDLSCLKDKEKIYFNGQKAFNCYKKYYRNSKEKSKLIDPKDKKIQLLPSSSRANTNKEKKQKAWNKIRGKLC